MSREVVQRRASDLAKYGKQAEDAPVGSRRRREHVWPAVICHVEGKRMKNSPETQLDGLRWRRQICWARHDEQRQEAILGRQLEHDHVLGSNAYITITYVNVESIYKAFPLTVLVHFGWDSNRPPVVVLWSMQCIFLMSQSCNSVRLRTWQSSPRAVFFLYFSAELESDCFPKKTSYRRPWPVNN